MSLSWAPTDHLGSIPEATLCPATLPDPSVTKHTRGFGDRACAAKPAGRCFPDLVKKAWDGGFGAPPSLPTPPSSWGGRSTLITVGLVLRAASFHRARL